ncbi:hypothetical protein SLS56_003401 [Neofusicoccum ribis]|uniref:RNase H type-1 domain-containing protein n=1 Tax=Neofusicoccum ribis TaxID=45134 RepID=A0ABR3SZG7_9PEZI
MAAPTDGKKFLGKVVILSMEDALKHARSDKPETGPGRLVLWTDMSMFDGRVGLAAAYKLHTDRFWRELTECLEATMREQSAELGAIRLGLEGAQSLRRPEDKEVVLWSDSRDALAKIRAWEAPEAAQDQGSGEDDELRERIIEIVGQIQAGKTWEEADVKVTLCWVKAHAHKRSRDGDGMKAIMGNCWADWMAGYAISQKYAKQRSRHDTQALHILSLVEKREAADKAARDAVKAAREVEDDVDAILQAEEDAMKAEQGQSMAEGEYA